MSQAAIAARSRWFLIDAQPKPCGVGGRRSRSSRAAPAPVRAATSEAEAEQPARTLVDAPLISLSGEGVRDARIPAEPGVYAIYNDDEEVQYIGLSRKVAASVKLHAFELPQYCGFVRCVVLPDAAKADLQAGWKRWMMEHLTLSGGKLPPGNVKGDTLWSERKGSTAKGNVNLTDGKGGAVDDAKLLQLCRETVDAHDIVAFIKGTRKEPECGFSHRVCAMLDELLVDYETVDTLDEVHNHNLRNVLKDFGDWPTIPQVYHKGELVGGHDILEEMHKSGELRSLLASPPR